MKIVQVNAAFAVSSTGRTTKEMHEYLAEKGYDSYVFCPQANVQDKNVFEIGNGFDHKLHSLWSLLFGCQAEYSVFATKCMLKQWDSIKPDVVLLRNLHSNYINLPMVLRYLSENDIPTVNVLHDFFSMTGHCCHYVVDECEKWKTECNNCPITHKYNRSLFFDRSRHCFKNKAKGWLSIPRLAVVGVSNWTRDEARKSPMFKNARVIERIYNWVDVDCFRPQIVQGLREKTGISEDDFVILGIAQLWSENKGLSKFILTARALPDCKFLMIGDISNNVDVPNNIVRVGVLKDFQELSKYYSLANVFLNFSVVETFGKVMAEALASGCPIICNNTTAIPELCGEGCGFIMEKGTWQEALALIQKVREKSRDYYLRKCRDYSLNNFEQSKGLREYEILFEKIMSF